MSSHLRYELNVPAATEMLIGGGKYVILFHSWLDNEQRGKVIDPVTAWRPIAGKRAAVIDIVSRLQRVDQHLSPAERLTSNRNW